MGIHTVEKIGGTLEVRSNNYAYNEVVMSFNKMDILYPKRSISSMHFLPS